MSRRERKNIRRVKFILVEGEGGVIEKGSNNEKKEETSFVISGEKRRRRNST